METALNEGVVLAFDFVRDERGVHSPQALATCTPYGEDARVCPEVFLNMRSPILPPVGARPVAVFEAMEAMVCLGELRCTLPSALIDLRHEFHNETNGHPLPGKRDLPGALLALGCLGAAPRQSAPSSSNKNAGQRALARAVASSRVLQRLLPRLTKHALLRGECAKARALMHRRGIPIDVQAHQFLLRNKERLSRHFIETHPEVARFYEGEVFKRHRVDEAASGCSDPWPRTETGQVKVTKDVLASRVKSTPWADSLEKVQKLRGMVQRYDLFVGSDGRARSVLEQSWTKTGRDINSSTREIFGLPPCYRRLITPGPGMGVGYVDYSNQDLGSAAGLSNDPEMLAAYRSGDPYMQLARQSGVVPADATRETHPKVRGQFKIVSLGVLYGMGRERMADNAGITEAKASQILNYHRQIFRVFWEWILSVTDFAQLARNLFSPFGTLLRVTDDTSVPTIQNFPIQSAGADMLHLACVELMNRGVGVCATAHDAVLIEAPIDELEDQVLVTRRAMEDASEIVLANLRLGTEAEVFFHPDTLRDPRGDKSWEQLQHAARALGGRL